MVFLVQMLPISSLSHASQGMSCSHCQFPYSAMAPSLLSLHPLLPPSLLSVQQQHGSSEPVYYASFRLFNASLVRVNIISGRASRCREGIQAALSVIILWDNYFIITPLYLFLVNDIGVVCFLFSCNAHPTLP